MGGGGGGVSTVFCSFLCVQVLWKRSTVQRIGEGSRYRETAFSYIAQLRLQHTVIVLC